MKSPSHAATVKVRSMRTNSRITFRKYYRRAGFILVALFFAFSVRAGQQATDSNDMNQSPEIEAKGQLPLVVPVYPRFKPKDDPASIESLRDTYIVLDDGSVLSLADWVLGSLNKTDTNSIMSDFQNRLFLGQVARGVAGLDQNLIYRSFKDSGPSIPYTEQPLSDAAALSKGLIQQLVPGLFPDGKPIPGQINELGIGLVPLASPRASRFGFANHYQVRSSGGSILFDDQFFAALEQTRGEFLERGRIMKIVEDYERAAAKAR